MEKADFDAFYDALGEPWGKPASRPPVVLHYHWWTILRWQRTKFAPQLFAALGLAPGDSIVLVGAGFNGTGAGLEDLGIEVIGTDLSNYIAAQAGQTEESELRAAITAAGLDPDAFTIDTPLADRFGVTRGQLLLDILLEGGVANPKARGKGIVVAEDMRNRGSRNSIRNLLNSTPRYAISEEVLNVLSDANALTLCGYAADLASETGCTIVHALSPLNPLTASQAPQFNWKPYKAWRDLLDANGFAAQRILPTVTAPAQGMAQPDLAGWVAHLVEMGHSAESAQATAPAMISGQWVAEYSGII